MLVEKGFPGPKGVGLDDGDDWRGWIDFAASELALSTCAVSHRAFIWLYQTSVVGLLNSINSICSLVIYVV